MVFSQYNSRLDLKLTLLICLKTTTVFSSNNLNILSYKKFDY
ncbi:hypothetical protein RCH18_000172 [Flavobacterium sp. PL11]|nr:hypothetical protein [Flavobacterium sp. PL11]